MNWVWNGEVFSRLVNYAGKCIGRGLTIRPHYNYNGGGEKHFGGAIKWPVITVLIPFVEGAEAERDAFVKKIQEFIDKEMQMGEHIDAAAIRQDDRVFTARKRSSCAGRTKSTFRSHNSARRQKSRRATG